MATRNELHSKLVSCLGTNNVYFQPPENIKIIYPCFVYYRKEPQQINADDSLYRLYKQYDVTYVSKDPESMLNGVDMTEKLLHIFKHIKFVSHYTSDNLYHDKYIIYY